MQGTSRLLSLPFFSAPCRFGYSKKLSVIAHQAQPKGNVVDILRSRGLVQDLTGPELEVLAAKKCISVYCGFDPTAESLHLGNLLGIVVLAWFQKCGHRPVALLGGATARVGDPSGKSAERPVLSDAMIAQNIKGIEATLKQLLEVSSNPDLKEPLFVNNLDWLGNMNLLAFLKDVGKCARVGTMMAKDSVRNRLESETGISFTEFTYQLLQGYDFVHLAKSENVQVQIGGSDQWGNIIAGTELIRKMMGSETECHGLTFPLLLKADGNKFGKSEGGAIWLSPTSLSPYKFYQFLFNTADADVIKLLKCLTFVSLEEIVELEESMTLPQYVPNTAQRRLAEEVTRFVHGHAGLAQALKATEALKPGTETQLDAATLLQSDAPMADLSKSEVVGKMLADVMVTVGMQPSKAAVRRMIKGGGVRVNNSKVEDEERDIREEDLVDGQLLLLAAGKKNKIVVRVL